MTAPKPIFENEFDRAALDTSSLWLPTPPAPDAEEEGTRGVVEDTLTVRETRYGAFVNNARPAQEIKNIYRGAPGWQRLDADMQEALDQIASKIGRILSHTADPYYADNWHDIQGYAKLIEQRLIKRSK